MRIEPFQTTTFKLSAVAALAALLRFWGLGLKQLWVDEIIQVIHSRPNSIREILAGVAQDRGGAPLDYLIQHLFISHSGPTIELTARLHAALFGTLSVVLMFFVCDKLISDKRLALLCALLFAVYPFHHHYSQEGRPYSLFVLLTLCLYLLLFHALQRHSRRRWGLFAVCAALALYTHPFAALVLLGQFIILVAAFAHHDDQRHAARSLAFFSISALLAGLAYLPWAVYTFGNAKGDAPEKIDYRLALRIFKELADGSYPLAVLLLICTIGGVWRLVQMRRRFELKVLLIWLLTPIPIVLAILLWRNYFFATRQLIFITPAIFVLVTLGIDYFKLKVKRRWFLPEAVVIGISMVMIFLHHADNREDLRATAYYLRNIVRPADVVEAPNLGGVLAFYFPEIDHYTAATPSRIIYVDSRYNVDHTELDTLLSRKSRQQKVEFRGVAVYIFEP